MFVRLRHVALLCVALFGCGADEAPSVETSTQPAHDPIAEAPLEEDDEDEEPLEDEAPVEVGVEEMDEHALEAACFAGQHAACDQLGH